MLVTALIALLRTPQKDRWLLRAPIGLYAGWLTAASSVSVALLGAGYGVAFGQVTWAFITITIAFVIGMNMILTRKAPGTYVFAVAWALVGLVVQNMTATPMIAAIAATGAVTLAALFIYVIRKPETGAQA